MKKYILFLAIFSVFLGIAGAEAKYSIGLSPNYIDLGQLEKGSSHSVSFKVFSQSSESVIVKMESYTSGTDTIKAKYPEMLDSFSEEEVSSWISFVKNPVEMEPASADSRSWKEINFFLNIPSNAEPGYHAVILRPSLYIPDEKMGTVGSRVIGVTSFMVIFYVKGNAVREGTILDVVKSGYSGGRIEFSTHFQNTGTVTIYAKSSSTSGSSKGSSASDKVAPEEIKVMKSYLSSEGLSCSSNCQMETKVEYVTGSAIMGTQFSVTGPVPLIAAPEKGFDIIPILIIIAIALLAGAIIKRFLNEY